MLDQLFENALPDRPPDAPDYVVELADAVLTTAHTARASDVHLVPEADGWAVRFRVDGVMHDVARLATDVGRRLIVRLKVLADLLTYRTEIPQEGRIRSSGVVAPETRLSTFPTLHGEKAVVRLFHGAASHTRLDELGHADDVQGRLGGLLDSTSGALLISGPAGSGKTTTAYACLREIMNKSERRRSLVSLEDPIEVEVVGVAQSQVQPSAGFDMSGGLRALLRQDPDVILVGEIRDRGTAEVVLQASLTGHLVLSTFHAGSAAQAVSRLFDMEIEPYLLRSGLLAILCQRLLRTLCECRRPVPNEVSLWGQKLEVAWEPFGCEVCQGTGYVGRQPAGELLLPSELGDRAQVIRYQDASQIERRAVAAGFRTQFDAARQLVLTGATSPVEAFRVLADQRLGGTGAEASPQVPS